MHSCVKKERGEGNPSFPRATRNSLSELEDDSVCGFHVMLRKIHFGTWMVLQGAGNVAALPKVSAKTVV